MTAEATYIQLVNGACQYSKADSLSRVVAQPEEMPNFNSDLLDSFSVPEMPHRLFYLSRFEHNRTVFPSAEASQHTTKSLYRA